MFFKEKFSSTSWKFFEDEFTFPDHSHFLIRMGDQSGLGYNFMRELPIEENLSIRQ